MSLAVEAVSKTLGGRVVLEQVSLSCADGGVVVIQGENGAGKSTLLRIVAGILAPDAGQVTLRGLPVRGRSGAALHALGYLPDAATALPELTVDELVDLVAALKGAAPLSDVLFERFGLRGLRDRRLGVLSLGERRRAGLAAALVGDPWLLVLDEPTEGLDAHGAAELTALLRERSAAGKATVVATHDIALRDALAGRVLRLAQARLSE